MKALALKALGALLLATAVVLWLSRATDWPVQSLVARWAPPPSDFIELDGQLVHLRDEGPRDDPAPLLLLHGLASSLHTWEGWAAALRGDHRVISLDLPGSGLTGPRADADYGPAADAAFVLAVMDRLRLRRVVLGGNGLGGEIAWGVAAQAGDRVAGLILVNAVDPASADESLALARLLATAPVLNRLIEYALPRAVVAERLHALYGDGSRLSDARVDRSHQLLLREGNRRALVQRLQQRHGGAGGAAPSPPTLVLWGARDPLLAPAWAQRTQSRIAGSRLVVFDALGHLPQEEDAAGTERVVREFLRGL